MHEYLRLKTFAQRKAVRELRSAYEDIIGREIAYHNNSTFWIKVKTYANEIAVQIQIDRQEKEFGKPK